MTTVGDWDSILRLRLSGRMSIASTMAVAVEAMSDEAMLDTLFQLLYYGDDPLRWRAAWVLEKVSASCPSLVVGERCRLLRLVMRMDLPNRVRRLLLSILYHLPDDEILDVPLFNFLLDVMCSPQSSSGVQSLSMKLACRMSRMDPDLHQEFLCVVRNMEPDYCSAGVRAVIRNCLRLG